MIFELIILKVLSLFLYSFIAIIIWDVITRHLLMEKIFSLILVFFFLSFWLLLNGLEFLPLVILLLYVGAISVLFLFVVMILNPDFLDLLNNKKLLSQKLQQRNSLLAQNFLENATPNTKGFDQVNFYNKINSILDQSSIKNDMEETSSKYYSSFFFGLLAGSFFAFIVMAKHNIGLKFILNTFGIHKVTQSYPVQTVEATLENQLGLLTQEGVNFFSGLKIQALYLPLTMEKNEVINIGLLMYTKYSGGLLIIGIMLLVSMMGAIILTLRQTTLTKKQLIGLQSIRYYS